MKREAKMIPIPIETFSNAKLYTAANWPQLMRTTELNDIQLVFVYQLRIYSI